MTKLETLIVFVAFYLAHVIFKFRFD